MQPQLIGGSAGIAQSSLSDAKTISKPGNHALKDLAVLAIAKEGARKDDGDDLRGDLESALEGDFDFAGSYSYGTALPQAPNPCLQIEGLGLLGLPLSERDAKLIIGSSSQAPYGHGDKTVVNKQVRDTWEIEPTRVTFGNPAWNTFFVATIEAICAKLGVAKSVNPPRCDLCKLLLYEPGSHFLPHQDTEKVDGMFATVVVVLPSSYTGGQVHVSHANSTEIIDLAQHSFTTICALAWYTDVVHEVKPVTSGYRLALTYNLIHISPGIPRPTLPTLHEAIDDLRTVLRRWSEGRYPNDSDIQVIAYLLKHKYSEVNLKMGALKGEDAHKISHLRGVAEELGYVVGLANLSYTESGPADGYGYCDYGRNKRRRYGYFSDSDDCDDDVPDMDEVTETELDISNLVDLNGVQILGLGNFCLTQENLIPADPFADVDPDDKDYEGYMGNWSGDVQHSYRRTVLVLFHRQNELSLFLSAGGVSYALQRIQRSTSKDKTPDNVKMVNYILQSANRVTDRLALSAVADYGLLWKDVDIWKQAVAKAVVSKDTGLFGKEKLLEACRTFPFEEIRRLLEDTLKNYNNFRDQADLIEFLRKTSQENILHWCSEQISLILASLKMPTVDDIPALMILVAARGLSFVVDIILPQVGKAASTYDFWVAFVKALHEKKASLIGTLQSESSGEILPDQDGTVFGQVIGQCLNAAIRQWDATTASSSYSSWTANIADRKISRIIQLVGLCITIPDMNACTRLILVVVRSNGDPTSRFQTLYRPLIPRLRELLNKHRIDICSSPFGDFMRILIGMHLSAVLGPKPRRSVANVRKIGCGCLECSQLDAFLMSNQITTQFPARQDRRAHLERQALKAPDLVTFHTIRSGSPHTLVVTKRPEISASIQWQVRQTEAKTLMSSIGNADVITKIMGSRYADVQKALDGTQAYAMKLPEAGKEQQSTTNAVASQSTSSHTQLSGSSRRQSSSVTESLTLKRKREGEKVVPAVAMATATTATGITAARDPATTYADAKRRVQNVLATTSGTSGSTISSQSARPSTIPTSANATKPSMPIQATPVPRQPTAGNHNHNKDKPPRTQVPKSLTRSQPGNLTSQAKPSASSASKKTHHNYIGPVIDMSDEG